MPTYGYDCPRCGAFDLVRPMAQASAAATCRECGGVARRVWGSPALRSLDAGVRQAFDAEARSGDSPAVVSSLPANQRNRTRYTRDPRHLRLPRP